MLRILLLSSNILIDSKNPNHNKKTKVVLSNFILIGNFSLLINMITIIMADFFIFLKVSNNNINFRQNIDLNSKFSDPFQIVIEAIVGGQEIGDITMDDLVFRENCLLSELSELPLGSTIAPTPNPCPDGQHTCPTSATCIEEDKL